METVGGRAVHPVNVRVGGFYGAPSDVVAALAEPLRAGARRGSGHGRVGVGVRIPRREGDYRFVALRGSERYPIESGRPISSEGLDVSPAEFGDLVVEAHVARSTALQARLAGRDPYLTGPLARFALNADLLPPLAAEAAAAAGLVPPCTNPFRSVVVRAVELVVACDEALRLVEAYEPPDPPSATVTGRAGSGTGVTEAPRGSSSSTTNSMRRARSAAPGSFRPPPRTS